MQAWGFEKVQAVNPKNHMLLSGKSTRVPNGFYAIKNRGYEN